MIAFRETVQYSRRALQIKRGKKNTGKRKNVDTFKKAKLIVASRRVKTESFREPLECRVNLLSTFYHCQCKLDGRYPLKLFLTAN